MVRLRSASLEGTCFLGPTATRIPRSAMSFRFESDPGPSARRILSVRRRPGPVQVTWPIGPIADRPFEVARFLDPIATRAPQNDGFSRPDCDPGPSKHNVFSVRWRPGPSGVTRFIGPTAARTFGEMCFLGPVATRAPRSDVFPRSDCDPDPSGCHVFSARLCPGPL